MDKLIAPVFFKRKSCTLPGIGVLAIVTEPAQTDFVNTAIRAPQQKIIFTSATDEKVFNEFSAVSEVLKKRLETDREVDLKGIGRFILQEGIIRFEPIELPSGFFASVPAHRVVRQDAEHAILVGDKETNSVKMTEYFNEIPAKHSRWWIIALILGLLGSAVIAFYYFQNGFNGLGNQTPLYGY